jgi:hypothetical protein
MERRRRKGENLSVQGMGLEWSFAGLCKAAELVEAEGCSC